VNNHPNVCTYMEWKPNRVTCPECHCYLYDEHLFDSSHVILAISKMNTEGKLKEFILSSEDLLAFGVLNLSQPVHIDDILTDIVWILSDSTRFFDIMEVWLKKKEK
jgi:hypothetical protein